MKANQRERILQYLDDFGSITPIEALSELGVMRLAPRIMELKRMGHRIESETEFHINRYGERKHYARYRKAV